MAKAKEAGPPKTRKAATRIMSSYPYTRCRSLQHVWREHGPIVLEGRALRKTYRCENCPMERHDVLFSNGEKDTSYSRPADYSLRGWGDLAPGRRDWRRVEYAALLPKAKKAT